jgi:Uma2 family endonuclease
MSTRIEASIDDLYRVPGKAELVGGEIIIMSPTGGFANYAAGEIYSSLRAHVRRTQRGHASTDNLGFVVDLPNRKSFSPDAAYFTSRLSEKFVQGAPAFAAEVRSAGEYGPAAEREMADKRADYFAAGTLVVWDVDLKDSDVVRVYRASDPEHPTIYRRGEVAAAEPAVPGWSMPVDDLFSPDEA